MGSRVFLRIQTQERVGQEWTVKGSRLSLRVKALMGLSTTIMGWVARLIVLKVDVRRRQGGPLPQRLDVVRDAYRSILDSTGREVVLLKGLYLTDSNFIEDGKPPLRDNNRLINFAKHIKICRIIQQFGASKKSITLRNCIIFKIGNGSVDGERIGMVEELGKTAAVRKGGARGEEEDGTGLGLGL
ncbi:hypothetical protein HK097_008079 [Rhizophlyctis rosea]|uniref:Uncharacterized protein n=1 Tax=Rhizophlyctis rosea TaxID=64517 RepID=A0AAD5SAS6_9FUNG|nr:hypothetical protein HK097_008079 [Rhizophlyctis rosea]